MGRKKLSEDKKNLIRKRLLQGCTVKAIADEVQVSSKTVYRYKKSSPAPFYNKQDTGDNSITYDYSTCLTKTEEMYAKKIEKEIALYEDIEEGWIYHLSESDMRWQTSGLWWSVIVYPDSAPKNWIKTLVAQRLRIAISPLHDKDTWDHDSPEMVNAATGEIIPKGERYKMGTRKKAHWHVIIITDKRTSYREMNYLLQKLTNCPYIQKCRSLRNAYDYFLHINAPNKYQGYDRAEIQEFNNFHIEPNRFEIGMLQDEIFRTIKEHDFVEWREVVDFYLGQPEYIMLLSSRPGAISGYLKSKWNFKNPKGKVQRISIVNEDEDKDKNEK